MASPGTTITFTGDRNQGVQIGHNSGAIHVAAPLVRPDSPPPPPSCFVPFRRDPDFVDRGTLLSQIRERCSVPAACVALVGLGGVGKSQLAIEYCYRVAEESPGTWIFWVHASNITRLEQSFRDMADQVKIRDRNGPQADVFKLARDWLREQKNGPWLLVLDNADDAGVLSPSPPGSNSTGDAGGLRQHLSQYLPPSAHGSVIVTSRTRSAAREMVEDSDMISVEPMYDTASHALLRKKLGTDLHGSDGIAELATTLDHMPLALVQAAAYIRKRAPRCSVRQYLEEYHQSDGKKTSLLNQEAGHLRRDRTASNSVLLTWQISFDHIRSIRKSSTNLLSLMSFFDRQGIQEYLLRSADDKAEKDSDDFEQDIITLRDYSFITITKDIGTFEMHSLIQLATRTWLQNKGEVEKWRKRFIFNLCRELPPEVGYENSGKYQALFPHVQLAMTQRPRDKGSLEKWGALLYKAAGYELQRGRADDAERMSKVSTDVWRELHGEEHKNTLISMMMMGTVMESVGKFQETEMIYRETLPLSEKVYGQLHGTTLIIISNFATLLYKQCRHEECEAMIGEALSRLKGPDSRGKLIAMFNLGALLNYQGKYDEAESMIREVLAQFEKLHGLEHSETLRAMNCLAQVLDSQGKHEESETMLRETLVVMEKVLGSDHPVTLQAINLLGGVLEHRGNYEESETTFREVLARMERSLGPEHGHIVRPLADILRVLEPQGKHEVCEATYREALTRVKISYKIRGSRCFKHYEPIRKDVRTPPEVRRV